VSIYTDEGYKDQNEYLESLAEEYGLSSEDVRMAADMLGPDEDFDGLITTLEDMSLEL
jgi:hypothetical protein